MNDPCRIIVGLFFWHLLQLPASATASLAVANHSTDTLKRLCNLMNTTCNAADELINVIEGKCSNRLINTVAIQRVWYVHVVWYQAERGRV